jgi:hypothetical protein
MEDDSLRHQYDGFLRGNVDSHAPTRLLLPSQASNLDCRIPLHGHKPQTALPDGAGYYFPPTVTK